MKNTGLAVLLLVGFGLDAMAAKAFKCLSDKSHFEIIEGWYAGEDSDSVFLKPSSVYGIRNLEEPGRPLVLKRDYNKSRMLGPLREYPIRFVAKQRDEFGPSTTVLAIKLGAFGGRIGQQFFAVLATDRQLLLSCEIVHKVELD